jgi:hypothetical protein
MGSGASKPALIGRRGGRARLKAAFSFSCLMGLTWLFGLLALANDTVALQYLFTIFNVFQVGCGNGMRRPKLPSRA